MSSAIPKIARRFPLGAEVINDGVSFRLWAPDRQRVVIEFEDRRYASVELNPQENGYFEGFAARIPPGTLYRVRLDDHDFRYPDPTSRYQPEGPHGPSQIIDPHRFLWTDHDWKGIGLNGQVIYELHLGTFSPEGTWQGAQSKLPLLKEMGITTIEIMPICDFSGDFGWGYDGVCFFAPSRLYGTPDDVRRFVDAAHRIGLGVILDVVYNHLGPDGNYLHAFGKSFFTDRYDTEWGEAINYDGPGCQGARDFVTTSGAYWISEFHFDGLRLDATQNIYDESERHILADLSVATRQAAGNRSIILVAENESQIVKQVIPLEEGGYGLDALWNDDLHHSAIVALTGHSEAYYSDYEGRPQELISAIKWGYLYQGQWFSWQKKRRGTSSLKLKPEHFVNFIENHDQVANSGKGQRVHQQSSPGRFRALTGMILLTPGTPMLFQGQEFNCSTPFFFFASHAPDLAVLVAEGRRKFLAQFPRVASKEMQQMLPDPASPKTFERCKLNWDEFDKNQEAVALHRDLLKIRREDSVLSRQSADMDGAVLRNEAFVLRFFAPNDQDRILIVNLGRDLHLSPAPEPLLAEPAGMGWKQLWSSEDPKYGGSGTPALQRDNYWVIPGNAALLFAAERELTP